MRYVKRLGLAAMAAGALMALVGVGTAMAEGTLCSAAEETCSSANRWAVGTVFDFSQEESIQLKNTAGTETIDTCKESTVKGKITKNAGGTATTEGEITTLSWTGCTFPTSTTVLGGLKIAAGASGAGTVFSNSEIKVRINTVLFGICEYGVNAGTNLGVIDEGKGTAVTWVFNAKAERKNGCIGPPSGVWIGSYILTEPSITTFYVSKH